MCVCVCVCLNFLLNQDVNILFFLLEHYANEMDILRFTKNTILQH